MDTIYTTYGPVRGQCGHAHDSISDAERCVARDQSACQSQYGYSDRVPCIVDDDGYLLDLDGEPIWRCGSKANGAERAECI